MAENSRGGIYVPLLTAAVVRLQREETAEIIPSAPDESAPIFTRVLEGGPGWRERVELAVADARKVGATWPRITPHAESHIALFEAWRTCPEPQPPAAWPEGFW